MQQYIIYIINLDHLKIEWPIVNGLNLFRYVSELAALGGVNEKVKLQVNA